jgi:hypothetical protein
MPKPNCLVLSLGKGRRMREPDGWWRCDRCDARVRLPEGSTPRVGVKGASGTPNVYLLLVDGAELHRCSDLPDPNRW